MKSSRTWRPDVCRSAAVRLVGLRLPCPAPCPGPGQGQGAKTSFGQLPDQHVRQAQSLPFDNCEGELLVEHVLVEIRWSLPDSESPKVASRMLFSSIFVNRLSNCSGSLPQRLRAFRPGACLSEPRPAGSA